LKQLLSTSIPQPDELVSYPGYLTIGQTLSDKEYQLAQKDLAKFKPNFSFKVSSIDVLREKQNGSWSRLQTCSFGT